MQHCATWQPLSDAGPTSSLPAETPSANDATATCVGWFWSSDLGDIAKVETRIAKIATVTVTARIKTTQILSFDLNMYPFFSCLDHSSLVFLAEDLFDLHQSIEPQVTGAETRFHIRIALIFKADGPL
jgi:hypothetical protein